MEGKLETSLTRTEFKKVERDVAILDRRGTQLHYDSLLTTLEEAGELSKSLQQPPGLPVALQTRPQKWGQASRTQTLTYAPQRRWNARSELP